jgi:purine nucleosidase
VTRKLLLDTDPGCDDAVALAAALASDDLEVVGITTVAGNAPVADTTRNARAVLERLDRTDVPVAAGCPAPLTRDLVTAEEVHGAGGITGDLPAPTAGTVDAPAVEFILDAVADHGDDLTIAAVGPLTNLAAAIAIDPSLPAAVDDVSVMGGAADCPGNTTAAAEFNLYVDPEAAARVFAAATPRMVGLDVTHEATVPAEYVERLAAGDEPDRSLAAWLGYSEVDEILAGGLDGPQVVHDATVIVDVLADVLDYRELSVEVGTGDGLCRGATVADVNGVTDAEPNARVALGVDVERFRDRLAGLLDGL